MRLLSNKELALIARQGNIYNTAMSGTAMMSIDTILYPSFLKIEVKAPSIPKDNLNVILDKRTLNIFSSLKEPPRIGSNANFSLPLNYYSIDLPRNADLDRIEAKWIGNGKMEIIVPMLSHNQHDIPRRINIKKRF